MKYAKPLLALACLAAFGRGLSARDFIRDDRWIIAENPLLRRGLAGVPDMLRTGYWQAVQGPSATVSEYRPLLMLSFLGHVLTTGWDPRPMRAGNIILHMMSCLLLYEIFKRRMATAAAFAAAVAFAVMPVHAEAVSYLTGRSELLSASFMLGAWLCLEPGGPGRAAWGVALYFCAMLSKEHSILFPALLALSDWTFHGRLPWSTPRRRLYAGLGAAALAYLTLRSAALPDGFRAGIPYFGPETGLLTVLLTMARFAVSRYLLPSLTGAGLCSDFTRPLIPDAGLFAPEAWLCLLGWTGAFGAGAWAVKTRRPWGFWILAPSLFLLPTSHLILRLDSIGAERFLYLPSVGLAAGLGLLYARLRGRWWAAPAGLALASWFLVAAARRDQVWASELRFYEATVRCNPYAADARSALGAARLARGDKAGRADLEAAAALNPRSPQPYYNLARLAWEDGDSPKAELLLKASLERDPSSPNALSLMALVLEARGRQDEALRFHERALETLSWSPAAHYNLGRHFLARGRPDLALPRFKEYLRLDPRDPDAASIRQLVSGLEKRP